MSATAKMLIRHVFTGCHKAAAVGGLVQPIAGHRRRVVIDGLGHSNTLPHVPIQAVWQGRSKPSKLLIRRPANTMAAPWICWSKQLALGKAPVENAASAALELGRARPLAVPIHVDRPAECGTNLGMGNDPRAHAAIEIPSYAIIAVEYMDPVAASAVYACVEILDDSKIERLALISPLTPRCVPRTTRGW